MKKDYDAIIVGAGVAGLTCGTYLAKSGRKVLISEQHNIPGGYCTSFKRKGYNFDAGIHYLGGVTTGILGRILKELGIDKEIGFTQFDPTDKIILPDHILYIRAKNEDTINEFKKTFPDENKNIDGFFSFIAQKNILDIYSKVKKMSFKEFLDGFFKTDQIKAAISILLANIGVSANIIPAATAIVFFREFILDPGYYPKNGMQDFSNALASKFAEYGGDLLLKQKVEKITTKDNVVTGVVINNEKINTKKVISCCDATQLFKELLDLDNAKENAAVEQNLPSPSIFGLYLGVDIPLSEIVKESCTIWKSTTYDVNGLLSRLRENILADKIPFIMISFPFMHTNKFNKGCNSSIASFINAPYESKEFWDENREILTEKLMREIKSNISIPSDKIEVKFTATPLTFERYTLNNKGSAYGWAPSIHQSRFYRLPQQTSISGLFLAGHWCISGIGEGGVSGVASLGRNAARLVLISDKKEWEYSILAM